MLADVLEFQGPRMDCTEESIPDPEARVYSSTYDGSEVMQQFEADDAMGLQTTGVHRDMLYPVRTEGVYTVPTDPWPRDPEKEERDTTGVQKRKPMSMEDKATAGTNMVSLLLQHFQRHIS